MPDSEPPVVGASSRTRVLVLSAFLVLYGNCTALLVGSATPVTGWPGAFLGVLLILLTLAWAFRVAHFTSTDIGLNGRGMLGSVLNEQDEGESLLRSQITDGGSW